MERIACRQCNQKLYEGEINLHYSGASNEPILLHTHCEKQFKMAEKGLTYKCPKCSGSGKVMKENFFNFIGAGGWTGTYREDFNYDPCKLCDGNGYLEKEPIPVQKVVEWKKAE